MESASPTTTLLRDTLGLHFGRDCSNRRQPAHVPDSLRAQVIPLSASRRRLLVMADSMGVPVDSVGSMILQESRNPLSAGNAVASRTAFKYTSGYIISKNSTFVGKRVGVQHDARRDAAAEWHDITNGPLHSRGRPGEPDPDATIHVRCELAAESKPVVRRTGCAVRVSTGWTPAPRTTRGSERASSSSPPSRGSGPAGDSTRTSTCSPAT